MNLSKDFRISDLSAEIQQEIDLFLTELKKSYPNIAAVIVFDDPSHINDNTDNEINLCVVSDDFLNNLGCVYHIPCRGKESCMVRRHEDKLENIVDEAAEIKKTYAMEIRPYPMSVKMYLAGDTYYDNWLYGRSGLYYGDKKYDPKKVDSEINWDAVHNDAVSYEGKTHNDMPFKKGGKPHGIGDAHKRKYILPEREIKKRDKMMRKRKYAMMPKEMRLCSAKIYTAEQNQQQRRKQ